MQEKRPSVNPNAGFVEQLSLLEERLGVEPASPRTAEAGVWRSWAGLRPLGKIIRSFRLAGSRHFEEAGQRKRQSQSPLVKI